MQTAFGQGDKVLQQSVLRLSETLHIFAGGILSVAAGEAVAAGHMRLYDHAVYAVEFAFVRVEQFAYDADGKPPDRESVGAVRFSRNEFFLEIARLDFFDFYFYGFVLGQTAGQIYFEPDAVRLAVLPRFQKKTPFCFGCIIPKTRKKIYRKTVRKFRR